MGGSTSAVGLDGETIRPFRLQPIGVGVHRGSLGQLGALPVLIIVVGLIGGRQEPVPVECGHRFVPANARMPPQKVVVMFADFARAVVVTKFVVVGLGEGNPQEPDRQDREPQPSQARVI